MGALTTACTDFTEAWRRANLSYIEAPSRPIFGIGFRFDAGN